MAGHSALANWEQEQVAVFERMSLTLSELQNSLHGSRNRTTKAVGRFDK